MDMKCYGFNLNSTTDLIGGYAPGLTSIEYSGKQLEEPFENSDILVQVFIMLHLTIKRIYPQ